MKTALVGAARLSGEKGIAAFIEKRAGQWKGR